MVEHYLCFGSGLFGRVALSMPHLVEIKRMSQNFTYFKIALIFLVNVSGKRVAKVKDARNDSCSRNVFQHDSIKDAVKLTRKVDHIICKFSHLFIFVCNFPQSFLYK